MGLFDFFIGADINKGYEEFINTKDAVLLDVREVSEYKEGHLPKAKNLSLGNLSNIKSISKKLEVPIFVYCHSGGRATQATMMLKQLGYKNVKNIGGVISYKGKFVK